MPHTYNWDINKGILLFIIIIIIKVRLQPLLESYELYTQGHQQAKQSSKEKENKFKRIL